MNDNNNLPTIPNIYLTLDHYTVMFNNYEPIFAYFFPKNTYFFLYLI